MSFLKTQTTKALASPPAVLVGEERNTRFTSIFVREHACSSDPILVLELRQPNSDNNSMQINFTMDEAQELAASFKELAEYMRGLDF